MQAEIKHSLDPAPAPKVSDLPSHKNGSYRHDADGVWRSGGEVALERARRRTWGDPSILKSHGRGLISQTQAQAQAQA